MLPTWPHIGYSYGMSQQSVEVLECVEELWPHPTRGPWGLRVTYGRIGERVGVVGVEVYAVDPREIASVIPDWPAIDFLASPSRQGGRFVTTSGLRVPLAERVAEYLATLPRRAAKVAGSRTESAGHRRAARHLLGVVDQVRPPGRPGRPPLPEGHFEEIADLYERAVEQGQPPRVEIARVKCVSLSTAGKWATECRRRGLLPATPQGKPSAMRNRTERSTS